MSSKLHLIFFLSLIFLSCAESETKNTESDNKKQELDIKMQDELYEVKGKVKQINTTIFFLMDTLDESNSSKRIALFDKVGNLTQETSYSDGSLEATMLYTYDRSKNEGEAKKFIDDTLFSIRIMKYDNKGYLQEYIQTNVKTSKKTKTVFKNNSAGRPIEMTSEDGNTYVLERDNRGDLIKTTSFVSGIITHQNEGYDKAGNWTKQIGSYKEDQWLVKRQIEYYE